MFSQVTAFQTDADGTQLILYKNKDVLSKAHKRVNKLVVPSAKNNLDGRWNLEVPDLPLMVSNNEFVFQGCNTNVVNYKANRKG